MEIPPPINPSGLVQVIRPDSATGNWQVGQILKAVAISHTKNGQTILAVGRDTIQVRTELSMKPGERLALEVVRRAPELALRVVRVPPRDPRATIIRALLPTQSSAAPLLANANQLTRQPPAGIPQTVFTAMKTLLERMPTPQRLQTAEGLQRALRETGVFLENRLARASRTQANQVLNGDTKANLLRLARALNNWTPPASPASRTPAPPRPAVSIAVNTARPAPPPAPAPRITAPPMHRSVATNAGNGRNEGLALPPRRETAGDARPPRPGATRPPNLIDPRHPVVRTFAPRQTATGPATTQPVGTSDGSGARKPLTAPPGGSNPPSQNAARPAVNPPVRPTAPWPAMVPRPTARAAPDSQLARLPSQLREILIRQVEGALARIQLHQVTSTPSEGETRPAEWLMELPIRRSDGVDIWTLRITRDRNQQKPGSRQRGDDDPWNVTLSFDLPQLGPIQARIMVCGERVSTAFWVSQPATATRFQDRMERLRQRLQAAGLVVERLSCYRGEAPPPGDVQFSGLLDEQA